MQSQSIIRYLARRGSLDGSTKKEQVACDIIAESIKDKIMLLANLPFQRENEEYKKNVFLQFSKAFTKYETCLAENLQKTKIPGDDKSGTNINIENCCMVGSSTTYVDILMAHLCTWYVEEAGADLLEKFPLITSLQRRIVSLPQVEAFIRSDCWYPVGNNKYKEMVSTVLDRKI